MCGTSVENCTPEKWFKFLGTSNKHVNIPFNIQVNMVSNGSTKAMREYAYGCYEHSDMSHTKCSCENCKASCEQEDAYPNLEKEGCRMASMECNTAITLLAFGCICLTIMFIIVAHYVMKHSTDDEIDNLSHSEFRLPAIKEAECQFCNNTPPLKIHHISIHDCLRVLCIQYSKVIF
jgi:uridine phosphorylase